MSGYGSEFGPPSPGWIRFKSGLFLGLGFAVALKVVDGVLGPRSIKVCLERPKDYLDNYASDKIKCQLCMDKLHESCKRN
ncbi:hypothetical protein Dsin_002970 [Dipteronia sinensis]|uniref:Uncharacterized protein n=1 Tax=Dipteronia sinensis TaxID=43782 RepID=A0AAE0B842_9ROSI|nr:hypothetical protein Dsin_002970 [Dipteronia sinensis]